MRRIAHAGLAGQAQFYVPFGAVGASELTVTVAGVPVPFTFAGSYVILSEPLGADAVVIIETTSLGSSAGGAATEDTLRAVLNAINSGNNLPDEEGPPATNANVFAIPSTTTSVQLIGANANRHRDGTDIVNDSTANLYVRVGATPASLTNYSYKLGPGQSVLIDHYAGPIQGVWDSANGFARITEYL